MKTNNRDQHGFTLIELLASMVLFGIFASVTAASFVSNLRFNHEAETTSEAIQVAQQVLDNYRTQDPTGMPTTGTQSRVVTIDARNYTVVTTFCPVPTYCVSANERHLSSEVFFKNKKVYEVETVYSQMQ